MIVDPWQRLGTWFPEIPEEAWTKLHAYADMMREWNAKVNLISRKNIEEFEVRHLAHCLTVTTFLKLMNRTTVLDVGTGGGLPGIPMAICYPQAHFTLIDSIGKKIAVVSDITERLGLRNVKVIRGRVEELPTKRTYDFVTGRAVTAIPKFHEWVRKRLNKGQRNSIPNGILYWKGGDWEDELEGTKLQPSRIWDAGEILPEAGYEEKYILHFKA
jgi:16S rRNA (guanine527-N7)-methyltransferase